MSSDQPLTQQSVPSQADPQTPPEASSDVPQTDNVEARMPKFDALEPTENAGDREQTPLELLYDIDVTVTAELGRVVLPIGDLLKLGEGSVLELNRLLSEPVDLMAQGVRLARGEVVVVNDGFAVRIKEIESRRKTQ